MSLSLLPSRDAERAIEQVAPVLLRCHQRAVAINPALPGRVVIRLSVVDGELSVAKQPGDFPLALRRCIGALPNLKLQTPPHAATQLLVQLDASGVRVLERLAGVPPTRDKAARDLEGRGQRR